MRNRWVAHREELMQNAPIIDYKISDHSMCVWEFRHCALCKDNSIVEEELWQTIPCKIRFDVTECVRRVYNNR